MNDAQADKIKGELDAVLAGVSQNVGIAFGEALFEEFRKRGWLTLETFGVLGTTLFASRLPAYDKTHYAFMSWDVDEEKFTVGKET